MKPTPVHHGSRLESEVVQCTSVMTRQNVPWLRAAGEVLHVQDTASAANNIRVEQAAKTLWGANMDRNAAPAAWAIVAQYASEMRE